MPTSRHRQFRGKVNAGPTVSDRRAAECPRCGAARYDRCFRLTSWVVDPEHADGGFYTARQDDVHSERPTPSAARAVVSERAELRKELGRLVMKKLGGSDRVRVRRWSREVNRTEAELRAKVDELRAMSDLAW